MTNKELMLKFYDEVFNGWDTSHLDQFVRPDYIQHNPTVEDGLEGFTKFIEFFTSMKPHVDIIRCDEVGDMVYVFFKCTMGNGMINKVVDMYRIEALLTLRGYKRTYGANIQCPTPLRKCH